MSRSNHPRTCSEMLRELFVSIDDEETKRVGPKKEVSVFLENIIRPLFNVQLLMVLCLQH